MVFFWVSPTEFSYEDIVELRGGMELVYGRGYRGQVTLSCKMIFSCEESKLETQGSLGQSVIGKSVTQS